MEQTLDLPARRAQPETHIAKLRERLAEMREKIAQLSSGEKTAASVVELAALRREAGQLQADIKTARVTWLTQRHADATLTAKVASQIVIDTAAELNRLSGQKSMAK